jgi:peptidoglycan-associated lipoprotein
MKIRHLIFVIAFAVSMIHSVSAQQLRNKDFLIGEREFRAGEYFSAFESYKKSYSSPVEKNNKGEILFKMGECFRLVNKPLSAERWYLQSVNRDSTNAQAVYNLALMQKMTSKYDAAKENFKKYKKLVPTDTRADDEIQSCELAQKWITNPNGYQVESMKFFNSKVSDFCPAYASDDFGTVYFTSCRDEATGKSKSEITGQKFADIFMSKVDRKGVWSTPAPLGPNVNTEFDEGFPCVSKDFKTLYFTRCEKVKNKDMGSKIFYAELEGEEWGKAKSLDIATDSVVVAHPAISPDELTLYFTSDLAGGYGGKDLWKVTRPDKNSAWSKPINLGSKINTKGDEEFPYIHADGTLYFSSNGLIGMGGFDIFKATPKDTTWKVENMGYPINSNADDFGICFQNDKERGYFSSSRTLTGDDDIYAFSLPPLRFSIAGMVRDEKTEQPIPDAVVKTISSDGLTVDNKADKTGTFRLSLKPNTDYVFITSKQGYLNGKDRQTTKGLDRSKDFKITIAMASTAKPIELPKIYYDFAKWDLRPESTVALDKLIETLNDNPNIIIELMSHTDARGNDNDNMALSQKRAQSVVNYLIDKGIVAERLQAKGYGKSMPKVVDKKLADQYTFLKEGTVLTEQFVNSITDTDLQEIAHQINRRTEFRVLSADYKPTK